MTPSISSGQPSRPLACILLAAAAISGSCSRGGGSSAAPITPTLTFGAPLQVPTGSNDGSSVSIADVDLDGVADVLVNNGSQANVSVMRGLGDGSLVGAALVSAPSRPFC